MVNFNKLGPAAKGYQAIPPQQRGIMSETEMAAEIAKIYAQNAETGEQVEKDIDAHKDRIAEEEMRLIQEIVNSATRLTDGTVHEIDPNSRQVVISLKGDTPMGGNNKVTRTLSEINRFWSELGKMRKELNEKHERGIAEIFTKAHRGLIQNKPQNP